MVSPLRRLLASSLSKVTQNRSLSCQNGLSIYICVRCPPEELTRHTFISFFTLYTRYNIAFSKNTYILSNDMLIYNKRRSTVLTMLRLPVFRNIYSMPFLTASAISFWISGSNERMGSISLPFILRST